MLQDSRHLLCRRASYRVHLPNAIEDLPLLQHHRLCEPVLSFTCCLVISDGQTGTNVLNGIQWSACLASGCTAPPVLTSVY